MTDENNTPVNDLEDLHKNPEERTPEPKKTSGETPTKTTEPPKKEPDKAVLCPKCGKPLIQMNIGGQDIWKHPDDDPCKEIYLSLEEIQAVHKKQEILKQAIEAEKKKQEKARSAENILKEIGKTNELAASLKESYETDITEIQQKLDQLLKLKESSNEVNLMNQTNNSLATIQNQLTTTANSMTSIQQQMNEINKSMEKYGKNDMTLKSIDEKLENIEINWRFTIKPITQTMIGNMINEALPDQKYNCVQEELTAINNVLTKITNTQKALANKLEKAKLTPRDDIEHERIPIYLEMLSLSRRLFNQWPTVIKYDRGTGKPISSNQGPTEDTQKEKPEISEEDNDEIKGIF